MFLTLSNILAPFVDMRTVGIVIGRGMILLRDDLRVAFSFEGMGTMSPLLSAKLKSSTDEAPVDMRLSRFDMPLSLLLLTLFVCFEAAAMIASISPSSKSSISSADPTSGMGSSPIAFGNRREPPLSSSSASSMLSSSSSSPSANASCTCRNLVLASWTSCAARSSISTKSSKLARVTKCSQHPFGAKMAAPWANSRLYTAVCSGPKCKACNKFVSTSKSVLPPSTCW
mmetsp:Transcript_4796/g.13812  ORF Transcript_4796/g.13812 Transcript_4796/m.13812 type:complete len:228 (+) Transcript_4796:3537-4220(+)